ncbi:MAG: carbohydrate ABC transporter substrate-binding protein [Spirochaetes bacterium]|nr:carbohydrate ABC transporter substrate-binding protein [Spirochaetota bacterium]
MPQQKKHIDNKGKTVLKTILKFVVFIALAVLNSCSLFYNQRIVLWTDQPEMAAYIENFNSNNDFYKVEIYYRSNAAASLSGTEKQPDIVIGKRINSPGLLSKFQPLDRLMGDEKIQPELFYRNLLSTGKADDKQMLLPLSFNLPGVIFKKDMDRKIPALMITLDKMLDLSRRFNKMRGSHFRKLGFSPFWDSNFLYYTAVLFGNAFPAGANGGVSIDKEEMKKAQNFINSWVNEANGGYDKEKAFTGKYVNIPMYKLVDDGRILFSIISSEDIFKIPEEKRKDLVFRWLSYNDAIPVEDNILYVGITDKAKNRRGALIFVKWLFNPSVQKQLLKINQFKRLDVFGICNGFSALKKITAQEIPKRNQLFLGHIPPENFLIFPLPKPQNWDLIKKKLINGWFLSEGTTKK